MAGDINYDEVFGVTEGEASPSGSAPDHVEENGSREKSAARAKEKGGAGADGSTPDGQGALRERPAEPLSVSTTESESFPFEEKTAPETVVPESRAAASQEQLLQLRQAEAAMRAERDYAVDRSIRQRIKSEVSEIGRLDPTVRSWEDIRNSSDYGRLGEMVKGGISLVDAYKLVHFDRLTQNAAAGARQAALNARSGKAHLQRLNGTGGETSGAVPGEVLRAYRAIMPELSTREIEQHYNQYLKG